MNKAYQAEIILRMLGSQKKMDEFDEDYKNARKHHGGGKSRLPNKTDLLIEKMYMKDKLTISEISQKLGMKYSKVISSMRLVAMQRHFNHYTS